jgi:hypothetical protein
LIFFYHSKDRIADSRNCCNLLIISVIGECEV